MRDLGGKHITDKAYVQAWQRLRNRGVHPTQQDKLDIDSIDYQKLLDEIRRVVVLMYHIVFSIIGYEGAYTDYAMRGPPQRIFPVSQNKEAGNTALELIRKLKPVVERNMKRRRRTSERKFIGQLAGFLKEEIKRKGLDKLEPKSKKSRKATSRNSGRKP